MRTILATLAALVTVSTAASAGYHSHHSHHGHHGHRYVRVVPSYTYVAPVSCKIVWHHGYSKKVCFKTYGH